MIPIGLEADHLSISRPGGRDDLIYKRIKAFILRTLAPQSVGPGGSTQDSTHVATRPKGYHDELSAMIESRDGDGLGRGSASQAVPSGRLGDDSPRSSTDLPRPAGTGDDDMLRFDARRAGGVLIGEGNTQINYYYNGTWTDGIAPQSASSPAPSSNSRHYRVFLCHSSGDKRRVRGLYRRLRQKGFDPWLDEAEIVAGQDWDAEIRRAVRAADLVIVCLSKTSIEKTGYVQREIRMVLDLADEQPDGRIFIIPAKLEACEVPDRLRRWQWVELYRPGGYERLFTALARASSENPS